MDTEAFSDEVPHLVHRQREGYSAFCASVDLLGIASMLESSPSEARDRLDDLQQGLVDALLFYSGGDDYRACFVGDSWFLVRELDPDQSEPDLWPAFCGHVFALAQFILETEKLIGEPGLRVVVSRGRLWRLSEPDESTMLGIKEKFAARWFVLTGASEALIKCRAVERAGSRDGFLGDFFWQESPETELTYWGTPLFKLPPSYYESRHYPTIYQLVCERKSHEVVLDKKHIRK